MSASASTRLKGGDDVLITPSMFFIGQALAMWPMSSFHSPHLREPHLDFKILYIALGSMIFTKYVVSYPGVAPIAAM